VPLTALLLAAGALGDLHGRRRVFAIGIALFALASLACGLAPRSSVLVAARAVQGAGAALMIPGSLALIAATFPAERLGRAVGAWSALSVVAMALGPVLGGALAERGLWRGVFLLNLPPALAALALLARVPESRSGESAARFDLAGTTLALAGLLGLCYGLLAAPERGWTDARVMGALSFGLALLAVFARVEARAARPMLPLALFRSRALAVAAAVTLLLYAAFHGWMVFVPLHLVNAQGYDELQAGLAQLPLLALLVLLSPLAGRLVDRRGARLPLTLGTALTTLGFLGFRAAGHTAGPSEYATRFLPSFLALGAGLGLCIAPLSTLVVASVGRERFALASGINSTLSRLAGVLGVALLGALGEPSASDGAGAFARRALLAAGLSAAAALTVRALPRGR
jgi:EmrB/QacA subfamily drug resistance transporter